MRARAWGALALVAGVAGMGLMTTAAAAVGASVAAGAVGARPMQLGIVLEPRDPAALAAFASAVSDPADPQYGAYLPAGQLASRFGATTGTIGAVDDALRTRGLTPGRVSADGLEIPVTGTTSAVSRAFGVAFAVAGGLFAPTASPVLPAAIVGDVQAVLGLDDLPSAQPEVSPPHAVAGPRSCAAAAAFPAKRTAVHPRDAFLTDDRIATAYGVDPLYHAGDDGHGVTVDVFEQEPNFPSDITAYERCFGLHVPIHYVSVDGGVGDPVVALDDGLETELDIENVATIAPGVSIDLYQAPDTGLAGIDEYREMVDSDNARVISTSWGECNEASVVFTLGLSGLEAENTIFEMAAAQGQSVLAASADQGAQDCDIPDIGSLSKRVDFPVTSTDDPASQPYVTGVGGTRLTLSATSQRVDEVVWNDGGPFAKGGQAAAGGGGPSREWAMPAWQYSTLRKRGWLPPPIDGTFNCPVTLNVPTDGYCREVPDVTGNADVFSAYVVYWHGAYVGVGGTSGSAPLWAGLIALGDSCSQSHDRAPLGFLNPALYRLADNASRYAHAFYDVTQGNNDVYPPLLPLEGFAAAPGYDMASGLGAPIAGGGTGVIDQMCATAPRTTRRA